MLKWLLLGLAVLVEVFATVCLRLSDGLTRWLPAVGVVAGYGLSFFLDAQVVRLGLSITIVYAVWSGGGIALVALANRVFFGEPITLGLAAGLALIGAGVVLVCTVSHGTG
ncbi:DMT family transporter [Amycolatopsis sp. NBC_00438]|jgi:small multidrug resistance pump|uniref:DMT family transporter n=1 Tax=Amycolatopsis sp. NBC_00438 TaxID=2903558 RepID=UPI002E1EF271